MAKRSKNGKNPKFGGLCWGMPSKKQERAKKLALEAELESKIADSLKGSRKTADIRGLLKVGQPWPRVGIFESADPYRVTQKDIDLLLIVQVKAPRLLDGSLLPSLQGLATQPYQRPLETWEPEGKGRERQFRSLCTHLLAMYPTPAFVWSLLSDHDTVGLASHLAAGGSLHKATKSGLMPIPLTKRMCHEVMQSPASNTFIEACRKVQVRAYGGDPSFITTWMATGQAQYWWDRETEEFWAWTLGWFCRNPMIEHSQVGPLLDYIGHRRQEDPEGFSMQGRSPLALLRGMAEWHGELTREKALKGREFKGSGYQPKYFKSHFRNKQGKVVEAYIWRVQEITTSKLLAAEGRELKHCVYSYANAIERGDSSIWSLTREEDMKDEDLQPSAHRSRQVTIEVRNNLKKVVQIRGKYNAMPTRQQMAFVQKWADLNNFQVQNTRW